MIRAGGSRRAFTLDTRAGFAPLDADLDYYGAAQIGAETIGARAVDPAVLEQVTAELEDEAATDDYVRYVRQYVEAGRHRAGAAWRYADITTVLAAATELLQPASYLEIGVRRGRSMAVVARRAPGCALIGVDSWAPDYAGMENPGPKLVEALLDRAGHTGSRALVSGNSHREVPRLFREHPRLTFDLITVDGDHSETGARADLEAVLPRLRAGGALVFDDISHPLHPGLLAVWRKAVTSDRRFATWEFDDIGYGVAVAVRRW